MTRYPHRRVLISSPPSHPSNYKPFNKPTAMDDPSFGAKSLTPQRKHHKLLKDGREVWSEDVEKIFVDGLKEYWESPWATYSRGRSRWRNQFLVDYLRKAGIERSKKQVASHIQVLRNMWRGEPEFHLVAGGEELFMENGLLASPKAIGASVSPSLPSRSESFDEGSSSSASTPEAFPADYGAHSSPAIPMSQLSPPEHVMTSFNPCLDAFSGTSPPSFVDLPFGGCSPSPPRHRPLPAVKLEPLHMHAGLFNLPVSSSQGSYIDSADLSLSFPPAPSTNRVLSLSLWAEGMITPYTVDVQRLTAAMATQPGSSSEATSVLLRIKISISSIEDIHSSPNLHGFQGSVTFSERWTSEARCITKTFTGPACSSQEIGFFDELSPSQLQPAHGFASQNILTALPDSPLSRCKWLSTNQEMITQQIVIDGVVLAAFVYHLERTVVEGSAPSAELVGFQKYKPSNRRSTPFNLSPQLSPLLSHSPQCFQPPTVYNTTITPQELALPPRSCMDLGDSPLSTGLAFNYHHHHQHQGPAGMYVGSPSAASSVSHSTFLPQS